MLFTKKKMLPTSEHYLLLCADVCVEHIRRKLGFKQII